MKTYHVTLLFSDGTSVDAEDEEEAIQIAKDIFKETGYDLDENPLVNANYELVAEESQDER